MVCSPPSTWLRTTRSWASAPSPGVSNGFWRNDDAFEDLAEIVDQIARDVSQLAEAGEIVIIKGGATAVSAVANLVDRYTEQVVHLSRGQGQPLRGYDPKVRVRLEEHLKRVGANLHPNP